MTEENLTFDVVIVGAGPSGLAAAIKLKQLASETKQDISICVVEKSSSIGGHILSGAVIDTGSLTELVPDWENDNSPINTKVTKDEFYYFHSHSKAFKIPSVLIPNSLKNDSCFIASLSDVVKWLAIKAEQLQIEIFTGFAATEVIYNDQQSVVGVKTGPFGINRDGSKNENYVAGISLLAKFTIFAEGSRGQLGKTLIKKFSLDNDSSPQNYSLGIKELWEIPSEKSQPGKVMHGFGWPLGFRTYGGSFLYHMKNNKISLGLIVGLNYRNPWLSPFEEFQKFKTHPKILEILQGGKRISYGARSLTSGSLYSLPKFVFPGGAMIGCNAGFLNSARIKGSHAAIKSGILVAESLFAHMDEKKDQSNFNLKNFETKFRESWLYSELNKTKNYKGFMRHGILVGGTLSFLEQKLFPNGTTLKVIVKERDCDAIRTLKNYPKKNYKPPDGKITFDRLSSLHFSGVNHTENQPIHLKLSDEKIPHKINFKKFAGPETRYCPAGVYEYLDENGQPSSKFNQYAKLQINAQNCLHCKACDIKDPSQNITWVAPEGGGGPNYEGM